MVVAVGRGTELYPRILGFDVKMFTNCRFGMMFWALGTVCYAQKQIENDGFLSNAMFVSVALQLIYISKFFYWETGYLCSMDIQHDRAGYYICWGCLVWVPCVYTSPAYFLVNHPNTELSAGHAALIFAAGLLCILINYSCDRQRQVFRASNGNCKIWFRDPEFITAEYETDKGERKQSLLLASGWWGVARHFHYVPEILGAFFWSLPSGLAPAYFLAYFYVIFLTPLLFDRAFRDDARCRDKYGKHWDKYCQRVPYKIIPGIL
jgi:7-dehydrocholesterol reductase